MIHSPSRRGFPGSVLLLGVFLIGLFITCTSSAEGTAEEISLEESYHRFRSSFGGSYTAEVLYSGFSPHRGTWELTVKGGELRQWVFRGKENLPEYRDFAEKLTLEALYNKAQKTGNLNVSYNDAGILSEIALPADGEGPTDRGYLIRVVHLKRIE